MNEERESEMKKEVKKVLAFLLSFMLAVGMSACGGGQESAGPIRVGYVNPTTGALAGNGEGCEWVVRQITEYVREHPIVVDGEEREIEIIVYDSMSDSNTCAEMAQKLIEEDNISLMIAIQTPNTVIPVAQIAERYEVPCIATQCPIDPLANAREEYLWTFDAFYTLDEVYESQRALWTQAGHPPRTGAKVGLLFANDADGTAWHDIFVRRLQEDGYEVVDPGQYPSGITDFTSVANTFKRAEIDVIAGTNIPPDFMNAYHAIISAGVSVDCITMGKCCLLESDVEALGELADGIMTQVWWTEVDPFQSDLTGVTCEELGAAYREENGGRTMPQPTAYAYAALDRRHHRKKRTPRRDCQSGHANCGGTYPLRQTDGWSDLWQHHTLRWTVAAGKRKLALKSH